MIQIQKAETVFQAAGGHDQIMLTSWRVIQSIRADNKANWW